MLSKDFSALSGKSLKYSLWDTAGKSQPCPNGRAMHKSHLKKRRTKGTIYQKIYAQYVKPEEKCGPNHMLQKAAHPSANEGEKQIIQRVVSINR